jgi:hypothetical protein
MSEPSETFSDGSTFQPRDVDFVKADPNCAPEKANASKSSSTSNQVPTIFDRLSNPATMTHGGAVFGKPAAMDATERAGNEGHNSTTGGGRVGSSTFGALGAFSAQEGLFGRPALKQAETDKRVAASQAIE